MNYGIFRNVLIMTLNDLAQMGSHAKWEKKAYKSNPNIKLELIKNNIELVPLTEKYVKGFKNLTKENHNLKSYLKAIIEAIKHFFRELLQIGNKRRRKPLQAK